MRRIKRWLKEVFEPETFNDLDVSAIGVAFNDQEVRAIWMTWVCDELRAMNMEVDKRLLSGSGASFTDLCARRKAFQDVLEAVLVANRRRMQEVRPNPRPSVINLDRVTA